SRPSHSSGAAAPSPTARTAAPSRIASACFPANHAASTVSTRYRRPVRAIAAHAASSPEGIRRKCSTTPQTTTAASARSNPCPERPAHKVHSMPLPSPPPAPAQPPSDRVLDLHIDLAGCEGKAELLRRVASAL